MSESDTKEALAITIRELGKQNEKLQLQINALLRKPKDARRMSACLGFVRQQADSSQVARAYNSQNRIRYQAQPQVVFKPERLCVSKESAAYWRIYDIKVGMNSQLIAPHPLPASLFAVANIHQLRELDLEDDFSAAVPMTYDVASPGVLITIEVEPLQSGTVVAGTVTRLPPSFECVMTGDVLEMTRADFPEGPLTLTLKKTAEN